ncbi:serine/threonine-protein kinase [Streptosporangium sp. KLBMP 9127]|nr:protein kinase [Streptosporangium sp. KLBMP 9127]
MRGGSKSVMSDGQQHSGRVVAGRYHLVEAIGRGGMGVVWAAHDDLLDRQVAVKEVRYASVLGDEVQQLNRRTLREARAAARLSHPNVVVVHDVIEEDGRPWIVMQLVPSRSLGQVIREDGPLPPRQVAKIGLEVVDALRSAHRAGVLHRDVKPENVLLADDGRVVLTDFGIATLEAETSLTMTGLAGTPAFIAPERLQGRPARRESDLWSLGATLYAAVEGRPPHDRGAAMATMHSVLTDPPDPAPHAGPLLPVIEGLLLKEPVQRLTHDEASRMLSRVLEGGSPTRPWPAVSAARPVTPAGPRPGAAPSPGVPVPPRPARPPGSPRPADREPPRPASPAARPPRPAPPVRQPPRPAPIRPVPSPALDQEPPNATLIWEVPNPTQIAPPVDPTRVAPPVNPEPAAPAPTRIAPSAAAPPARERPRPAPQRQTPGPATPKAPPATPEPVRPAQATPRRDLPEPAALDQIAPKTSGPEPSAEPPSTGQPAQGPHRRPPYAQPARSAGAFEQAAPSSVGAFGQAAPKGDWPKPDLPARGADESAAGSTGSDGPPAPAEQPVKPVAAPARRPSATRAEPGERETPPDPAPQATRQNPVPPEAATPEPATGTSAAPAAKSTAKPKARKPAAPAKTAPSVSGDDRTPPGSSAPGDPETPTAGDAVPAAAGDPETPDAAKSTSGATGPPAKSRTRKPAAPKATARTSGDGEAAPSDTSGDAEPAASRTAQSGRTSPAATGGKAATAEESTTESPATPPTDTPAEPATGTTSEPATGTTAEPATGSTAKTATGSTPKTAAGTSAKTAKTTTGSTAKTAAGNKAKPATGSTAKTKGRKPAASAEAATPETGDAASPAPAGAPAGRKTTTAKARTRKAAQQKPADEAAAGPDPAGDEPTGKLAQAAAAVPGGGEAPRPDGAPVAGEDHEAAVEDAATATTGSSPAPGTAAESEDGTAAPARTGPTPRPRPAATDAEPGTGGKARPQTGETRSEPGTGTDLAAESRSEAAPTADAEAAENAPEADLGKADAAPDVASTSAKKTGSRSDEDASAAGDRPPGPSDAADTGGSGTTKTATGSAATPAQTPDTPEPDTTNPDLDEPSRDPDSTELDLPDFGQNATDPDLDAPALRMDASIVGTGTLVSDGPTKKGATDTAPEATEPPALRSATSPSAATEAPKTPPKPTQEPTQETPADDADGAPVPGHVPGRPARPQTGQPKPGLTSTRRDPYEHAAGRAGVREHAAGPADASVRAEQDKPAAGRPGAGRTAVGASGEVEPERPTAQLQNPARLKARDDVRREQPRLPMGWEPDASGGQGPGRTSRRPTEPSAVRQQAERPGGGQRAEPPAVRQRAERPVSRPTATIMQEAVSRQSGFFGADRHDAEPDGMVLPERAWDRWPGMPSIRKALPVVVIAVLVVAGVAWWLGMRSASETSPDGMPEATSEATEPGNSGDPGGASENDGKSPTDPGTGQKTDPKTEEKGEKDDPKTAEPAGALPEGWRLHKDDNGFAIGLPKGWKVSKRAGGSVWFRGPGATAASYLLIDQTANPGPDPLKDWYVQEGASRPNFPGYKRVKIEKVDYMKSAADWEFTWRMSSGKARVINRGFVTDGGMGYAIYWHTLADTWKDDLRFFNGFSDTFKPAK